MQKASRIQVLYFLQQSPQVFYQILPKNFYDSWETFAVLQMGKILGVAVLIIIIVSLFLGVKVLLNPKIKILNSVLIFLFYISLIFLFFLLTTGLAREKVKRVACMCNMKQIGSALQIYAVYFDGFYPPDLETLVTESHLPDQSYLLCPSRNRPQHNFSDYIYFGNGHTTNDKTFLLLQDDHKNHVENYYNYLYSDGSVKHETP